MTDVTNRKSHYVTLQRHKTIVDGYTADTVTAEQVKSLLERLELIWKKLEKSHENIIATINENDEDAINLQHTVFAPMEETYLHTQAKLYGFQRKFATTPVHTTTFKLPDMTLPTFDGKFEDWSTFQDLFNSSIHKNPSLSGSQKLQYLKSCIKGDAANIIKSFIITDANYAEARSLLEQQYDNKREIIQSHVRRLINQPSITSESPTALQHMVTTTMECLRSLKVLGRPTDDWDDIIVVMTIDKFDVDTKAEWARTLRGTDPPILEEVLNFLQQHIRTLHAKGSNNISSKQQQSSSSHQWQQRQQINTHHSTHHSSQQENVTCQFCKESHRLYQCSKLIEMQDEERINTVRSMGACLNCLRSEHSTQECYSSSRCRKCNQKHNTFIHLDSRSADSNSFGKQAPAVNNSSQSAANGTHQSSNINSFGIHSTTVSSTPSTTLLKTAVVDVKDSSSTMHQLRLFLDDGGQASLISETAMNRLGLQKQKTSVIIKGVGGVTATRSRWKTSTRLFSTFNQSFFDVDLFAVPTVTQHNNFVEPSNPSTLQHLEGIELADPLFYKGGEVDILLGADAVPYIIESGIRRSDKNAPVAQNTIFGWVLFGNVSSTPPEAITSHQFTCELTNIANKFREQEEVPQQHSIPNEEDTCEQNSLSTHTAHEDGRHLVRLPFNSNKEKLSSTKQQPLSKSRQLEHRFRKYPKHKQKYIKFIMEDESLNHKQKVQVSSTAVYKPIYLPHQESTTIIISTATQLAAELSEAEKEADLEFKKDQHRSIKALGIRWQPASDRFGFQVKASMKAVGVIFKNLLFCWTDSTIAPCWISAHSTRWKTFVANRLSSIQSSVLTEHWHHIHTEHNSADLPSKRISAVQLSLSLWCHGPHMVIYTTVVIYTQVFSFIPAV